MTPLDLAQELGYRALYDILSPVIRQSVPTNTLRALQQKFHQLIKTDLGDRVEEEHIYLPLLEVLTELEIPQMWFPVKLHLYSPAVSISTNSSILVNLVTAFRVMCIVLMAVSLL